ncbi:preprotein translocase subunit SecB [Pseudomonas fluorescens]|uniref:preprotein translocase subunit SecB n=1 Tax=Pseudomonas fluorescens TaxID=294 RepID=UPI001241CE4E|nr:preprotein translocase subunit SecB [Pseudomonas fluorescens]
MSTEALAKAIASLKFVDVFITNSTSSLSNDFDPKFDARSERLSFQTKNFVTASAVIEGESEEGVLRMFRVTSELGVRIICKDDVDEGNPDPEVLAQVEATMEADYNIADLSIVEDQEALDAFALKNVSYHVWPYWREYVTSQLMRMNMPKLVLPMLLRATNQDQ